MKTLGLIGGTSWVSTMDYYKYINLGINERLGGLNYAHCILHSFCYADVKALMDVCDFDGVYEMFSKACLHLKQGGAEGIVLCANTMHMFADKLEQRVQLPVIHIATATANAIKARQLDRVAMLGTKFTMEKDFFKDKLTAQGIEMMTPGEEDKDFIHSSIFDEMGKGIFTQATKARYISIIESLVSNGAQGVILGCTEIPMLLSQEDVSVPVFDTTKLHADAAVAFCLG